MFQGTGALAFNAAFYLQNNPDVFQAIQNGTFQGSALDHFVQFGQFEGRDPNAFFDTEFYLANNTDVLVAIADPANPSVVSAFQHFVDFGSEEGVVRAPSAAFASFNAQSYLDANPDLQAAFGDLTGEALEDRLFQHFVEFGVNENRPGSGVAVDGGLPGQSFTLTTAIETLNGTANNDTFNAPLANNSLFGFQQNTLQTGDVINGGKGVDTLNATLAVTPSFAGIGGGDLNFTAAPTLNGVENVNLRFLDLGFADGEGDAFELDLSNSTGVQSVSVNASTAAGIISGLGAAATFAVTGDALGRSVTFNDTTSTDISLTVANYGTTQTGLIEFNADETIESLSLSLTNVDAEIVTNGGPLENVAIVVTGANVVDIDDADSVETVTVSGSGSLDLIGEDDFGTAFGNDLKSFDASNNSGGVQVDISDRGFGLGDTVTALTVSGGAGDDRFVFDVLDKGVTVNGGAGFDTAVVSGGTFADAATNAGFNNLTNVERLEFNDTDASVTTTITGEFLTNPGITNILFNTAGADIINVAGSARTYEFGSDNDGAATFNMKAGVTTLNLDYLGDEDEGGASTSALNVNLAEGSAATAVSTINIDSLGGADVFNDTGVITARAGSTINISGDANLDIDGLVNAGGAATAGFTVNASSLTGDLEFQGSVNGDTVTLGSGDSFITFAGGDSGTVTETTNPTIVNFDVITGFTAGAAGDVLAVDFEAGFDQGYAAVSAATQGLINQSLTLLDAFELAAADIDGGEGWTAFTFGTNTYVAFSDGVDGFGTDTVETIDGETVVTAEGADLLVQLNGVSVASLTQDNFGFGSLIA